MNKIEKALEACEKVIDGIEDSTITTESALLQTYMCLGDILTSQ